MTEDLALNGEKGQMSWTGKEEAGWVCGRLFTIWHKPILAGLLPLQ